MFPSAADDLRKVSESDWASPDELLAAEKRLPATIREATRRHEDVMGVPASVAGR